MENNWIKNNQIKNDGINHYNSRPETLLPTKFGTFRVRVYEFEGEDFATAIIAGPTEKKENLPVRVHSSCLTGESFESLKCDCKEQLNIALRYINNNGGVVLYLQQEGRGIGLGNKIRAYALQEQGHDTVDSNLKLGFSADLRKYDVVPMILDDLKINSIQLLTNNPDKVQALKSLSVKVNGRIPVLAKLNQYSAGYLESKRSRMGHMLELDRNGNGPSRPFVHVNFAMNNSSQYAAKNGEPLELSCGRDWQRVHKLREAYTAVAVGANTWYNDKPRLTARLEKLGKPPTRQPDRVIFAGKRKCSFIPDARRTFIIGNTHPAENDSRIEIIANDYDLEKPLYELRKHQVTSLLVEGGPTLIYSFLKQGFVDLLTIYVCSENEDAAIKIAQNVLPFKLHNFKMEPLGKGILININSPKYHKNGSMVELEKMTA